MDLYGYAKTSKICKDLCGFVNLCLELSGFLSVCEDL
jgi:hypothetical protein